jgi:hypothetical protein
LALLSLVLILQIGLGGTQSASTRHATQAWALVSQTGALDLAQSFAARHSTQVCEAGSQVSGSSHSDVVQSVVAGSVGGLAVPPSVLVTPSPGCREVTSPANGRFLPQLSSAQTAMATRTQAGDLELAGPLLIRMLCCPT